MVRSRKPDVPTDDASWQVFSQPILDFLDQPRDWAALKERAKDVGMTQTKLRNCIAWLEGNALIQSLKKKTTVRGRVRPEVVWIQTEGADHYLELPDFVCEEADSGYEETDTNEDEGKVCLEDP